MMVTAVDGAKPFVMQYGSHARVISPKELITAVRGEADELRGLYDERQ